MRFSPNFGLIIFEQGEDVFSEGWKHFNADVETIDRIIGLTLGGHVHDGSLAGTINPDDPLDLTTSPTGGQIGPGARIWYVYTLIHQATGQESTPSPAAFIDTPPPIEAPNAPSLAWGSSSGVLPPGQYFYALTAYTDVETNETQGGSQIGVVVSPGGSTNRIILTLPDLPDDADGFNVYRRKPGGRDYVYVDSVAMDVATPPDEYTDDGSIGEDPNRPLPVRNTTHSTNSVTAVLPDALVPDGYYWKIYRTVNEDSWFASLLHFVVEETEDLSGIITPEYTDIGTETTSGEPPTGSISFQNPQPIDLTDGAHVTGVLPMAQSSFPFVVTLAYPGLVDEVEGTAVWRCPFPQAEIIRVALSLGRDSAPASDDVIGDVNLFRAGEFAYDTIFTDPGDRPTVPVGEQFGSWTSPDVNLLLLDDHLSFDVDQEGGGATPTDENLIATIVLIVSGYPGESYEYDPAQGGNAGRGF